MLRTLLAAALFSLLQAPAQKPELDVIYVPTPQDVVDATLKLAGVKPGDVVYDLGCGDGRYVITAAKMGARGVGIDLDPQRITEPNTNARKARVTGWTAVLSVATLLLSATWNFLLNRAMVVAWKESSPPRPPTRTGRLG